MTPRLSSSLLLLILSATMITNEVSATPLLRLSDLIVGGTKCNQIVCPLDLQVFNETSCRCECIKTECFGYQLLNQQTCNCECPREKVASLCYHDNKLYDDSKCDCVAKIRKARQNPAGSAPPPPPPPPPPPSTICPITARNCTNDLKVFNQTACECQCIQYKPANITRECPTPEPRTPKTPTPRGRNRNNKPQPFDTNKYDYVYGDDGCPELTPKGKKYRKVKISRRGKRSKSSKSKSKSNSKSNSNSKSKDEPTTTETPPAGIRTPVDSCPVGQVANPDTCQCMEM